MFAVAAFLVLSSVPLLLANSAGAGWNIFLGLLLFGVLAANDERAPNVAYILAVILAIRALAGIGWGASLLDALIHAILAGATVAAAHDLRKQAGSA